MKTLRKNDIESMERELPVVVNCGKYVGGWNGTYIDPCPSMEFAYLYSTGAWEGGYVNAFGGPQWVDANGSSSSPSGSSTGSTGSVVSWGLSAILTGYVYANDPVSFINSIPELSNLGGKMEMIFDLTLLGAAQGATISAQPTSNGLQIKIDNKTYNLYY